ncbi:MAG: hypothetical protein OEX79_02875 [Nitrosopumilus sp.]|nr:hypothetical protein [Nitrosopumilus sp.]
MKENPQTKPVKTIGFATSKAQKDSAVFKYKLEAPLLRFAISIALFNLLIEFTKPSKDAKILLNFTIQKFQCVNVK